MIKNLIFRLFRLLKKVPACVASALVNSISGYKELLATGEIESTAKGEMVTISYKVNLCGDVLIFIEPNINYELPKPDLIDFIMKLIQTDNTIKEQNSLARKLLWYKLRGLSVIPKILTGIITLALSFFAYINTILNHKVDFFLISNIFPLLLIILAVIIHQYIGFKTISLIAFIINQIHHIQRKISSIFRQINQTDNQ
jgi:hypothetical protein